MSEAVDGDRLSREEKLRVMEAIWDKLSQESDQIESPDWHREALDETQGRLESGQESTMDWSEAKKGLRKRFEWAGRKGVADER